MRLFNVACFIIGLVCVTIGCAMVRPWLACIVGGGTLMVITLWGTKHEPPDTTDMGH